MKLFRKAKSALDQINRDQTRLGWRKIALSVLVALIVGALFCLVYYGLVYS
jgi:hypothetical protein